jgi:MFS family permease
MIVLDVSIVITALPQIHAALGFSPTSLSWVQNAYTLTFGGLMLLGARAGDILGRRRMFVVGIGLFTFASLLAGLAQSPGWLLGARAIQGVGAAVAAPSTLALLMTTFREGPERTRAVALYSAVAGAGGSVGLVLGGMLTAWISWRLGMLVNVPVGLALMWFAPRFLPETERRSGHFDLTGAITSTAGMAWLSQLSDGSGYFPQIALPLMLLGVGIGVAITPLTSAGIAGVAPEDAGAASGLVNVAHQLGGSLGIGILVTVFAAAERSTAPLAGLGRAAQARHELASAVSTSLTGSAILLALGLAVVVAVMRRPAVATAPALARAAGAR